VPVLEEETPTCKGWRFCWDIFGGPGRNRRWLGSAVIFIMLPGFLRLIASGVVLIDLHGR
jgi:hypothetical protein